MFQANGCGLARCTGCGLVYVNHKFTAQELAQYYREGYYCGECGLVYENYFADEELKIQGFRSRVEQIWKHYIHRGKLLDLGCAAGYFLEAAKPYFEVVGVELSDYAARYAREVFGHTVITGEVFDGKFPSNYFDVVTMWDVIEHLPNPRAVVQEIYRILKPRGLLVISTGDVESLNARRNLKGWKLIAPPWHLFYFSKRTLRQLLSTTGFRVRAIETNGVISYHPALNNRYVRFLVRHLRLGDIMTMYAEKS